jgi:YidC/Oxa1 family membrane protein insertase
MDRKTLLAVVISVVIIVAGMLITPLLSPPKPIPAPAASSQAAPQASAQQPAAPAAASNGQAAETQTTAQKPGTAPGAVAAAGQVQALADSAPPASQGDTFVRETDLYVLTFAADGATLTSVKLKKYKNVDGSPVEMLLLPPAGTSGEMPFALSFGDYTAEQLAVPFTLKESSGTNQFTYDFTRTFLSPTRVPFTLHKTYVFDRDEYLFELRVTIQDRKSVV